MSRPERIEYEGAFYHVMNRGRRREKTFHGPEYYESFLDTLSEAVERFDLRVHAYCLMSNHYHLLVSTPCANLQRAMRHIGGVYTQRYNRLRQTDGSLFRGRYKSILIDSDAYLLHVSKYIHLNPLEARMVDRLDDYSWSSYPSYVRKTKPESWLTMNEVYEQLTSSRLKASRYQAYVEEAEVDQEIIGFYSKKRQAPVLGDKSFRELVAKEITNASDIEVAKKDRLSVAPSMAEIVETVADYYHVTTTSLLKKQRGRGLKNFPRKVAMYLAQSKGRYRLTEIAIYFDLKHYGGVSSAINAVKSEMESDKKSIRDVNNITNRFDP